MSLDDKLREILQSYLRDWVENDGRPKHLVNDIEDELPKIKQAFVDENVYTLKKMEQVFNVLPLSMTGQEWYDRFEKELFKPFEKVGYKTLEEVNPDETEWILRAAKKAAGLK